MRSILFAGLALIGLSTFASTAALAHGCHRDAREDRRGLHRHVGPECARINLDDDGGYYERRRLPPGYWVAPDGQICTRKCDGIGPLRICKRSCK